MGTLWQPHIGINGQSSATKVSIPTQLVEQERILAAIDLGTNSIHMVVVQILPTLPALVLLPEKRDTVRLGDAPKPVS